MRQKIAVAGALFVALIGSKGDSFAATLAEGQAALQAKHYAQALQILTPLANGGDTDAQRLVGEMCFYGQGMKADKAAALEWLEVSASRGNRIAQFDLGFMYEQGEGVPRSLTTARDWYMKAAVQGYPPAQKKLGDLFASSDPSQAQYWYGKARNVGDEQADKGYLKMRQENEAREEAQRAKQAAEDAEDNRKEREFLAEGARRRAEFEAKTAADNAESQSSMPRQSTPFDGLNTINQAMRDGQRQIAAAQAARTAAQRRAQEEESSRAAAERNRQLLADANQRESEHRAAADQVAERQQQAQRDAVLRQEQAAQAAKAAKEQAEIAESKAIKTKEAEQARLAAAAEETKKKNYLLAVTQSLKLSDRSCPGGEGKHYLVGKMPSIKPRVLECIDVYYTTACPGSAVGASGVIKNFLGASTDCYMGDAAEVSPTPACNPKEVRVQVARVVGCSS